MGRTTPNPEKTHACLKGAATLLDLKITGARVIDGSGNPWRLADVGIQGDRIAAIGDLSGANDPGGRVGRLPGLHRHPLAQ
jgi:urease alpha subunit